MEAKMNKFEKWADERGAARVPPMPMWKQVTRTDGRWMKPVDATIAKLRRSRNQALVSFPSSVVPSVRYCDIYFDGQGRIAYHPNPVGAYKITRARGSRYHNAAVPASIERLMTCDVGSHEIAIEREGDMLVLDLRAYMKADAE